MKMMSFALLAVSIQQSALERLLNEKIPEILGAPRLPAITGLMIRIIRDGRVKVSFSDIHMHSAPLRLPLSLAFPLRVELYRAAAPDQKLAQGSILLNLDTVLQLSDSWQLSSETRLNSYEWVQQPQLRFGGLSLPLERTTNFIIEQAQKKIIAKIDEELSAKDKTPQAVNALLAQLRTPRYLDDEGEVYVNPGVNSICIDALQTIPGTLRAHIAVSLEPIVGLGTAPSFPRLALTNKAVCTESILSDIKPGTFDVGVRFYLPYVQLGNLLTEKLSGHTFSKAGFSISVASLEVRRQEGKLCFEIKTEGDLGLTLLLATDLRYDTKSYQFTLPALQVEVISGPRLLRRTAKIIGNLLGNRIKSEVEQQLNAALQEAVKQTNLKLDGEELRPGIRVRGKLYELRPDHIDLGTEELLLELRAAGHLHVYIDALTLPPAG